MISPYDASRGRARTLERQARQPGRHLGVYPRLSPVAVGQGAVTTGTGHAGPQLRVLQRGTVRPVQDTLELLVLPGPVRRCPPVAGESCNTLRGCADGGEDGRHLLAALVTVTAWCWARWAWVPRPTSGTEEIAAHERIVTGGSKALIGVLRPGPAAAAVDQMHAPSLSSGGRKGHL
jgi:hypothetical protein